MALDHPRRFLLGSLLAASLFAAPAPAQDVIYRLPGTWLKDKFGTSVANAGDVNKDGVPDIIVGAPGDDDNGTDSGSATVISGYDGSILYLVHGDLYVDHFGWAVAGAGDLDRDGYADFLVSAERTGAGYVRAFSGRTGSRLYTWYGDTQWDYFGYALAGLGDVDKDGYPDVIVGTRQDGVYGNGYARVFSGRDGRILFTLYGSRFVYFGASVAAAGDVNGDGHADVIVGAPGNATNHAGQAIVFSGKDASVLYDFVGDQLQVQYGLGLAVSGAGDVNADGTPDFAISARQPTISGYNTQPGMVLVLSGKSGTVLHQLFGDKGRDRFRLGWSLGRLADFDRDGYADILVGTGIGLESTEPGEARVYSGRTGSRLLTVLGSQAGDGLGTSVAWTDDVNQDGIADCVVGASLNDANGVDSGLALVCSGTRLSFKTDTHTLSLATGGTQRMQIDVGAARAGDIYLVLGSMSGNRPGITIGSHNLPLNPDLYHAFTLAQPDTLIKTSVGLLDFVGRGTADFVLPTGWPPELVGTRLHHAALVFRLTPFVATATTNAAVLSLVR